MRKYFGEFYLFSDILEQELRDPEFRRLWEADEEKEKKIRAKIEAKIRARKLKEGIVSDSGTASFAAN